MVFIPFLLTISLSVLIRIMDLISSKFRLQATFSHSTVIFYAGSIRLWTLWENSQTC